MPWGQQQQQQDQHQIEVKIAGTKKLAAENVLQVEVESAKVSKKHNTTTGVDVVKANLSGKSVSENPPPKNDKADVKGQSNESNPPKKEKDKSSKRKSNLNRALTEEAVPLPDYYNGDPPVRRRSRGSSRPLSQEYSSSSMEENLLLKDMQNQQSTTTGTIIPTVPASSTIIKPPQIPSILQSATEHKTVEATSPENLPSSPPTTTTKSSKQILPNGINNKIKVFESVNDSKSKSSSSTTNNTSVEKRDSLSDAEGMTCIKRLLQRESSAKKNLLSSNNNNSIENSGQNPLFIAKNSKEGLVSTNSNFHIKKSPSAGSAFNWSSKFSGNQPSFLKKFFDNKNESKDKAGTTFTTSTTNSVTDAADKTDEISEDSVLTLNVAQKANFFMKLEHEKRFSKWRKEFCTGSESTASSTTTPTVTDNKSIQMDTEPAQSKFSSAGGRSRTRFSTQPIKAEEVEAAAAHHHHFLAGLGKCWENARDTTKGKQQNQNGGENNKRMAGYVDDISYGDDDAELREVPWGGKSSYADRDDTFPPQMSKSLGLYDNVDPSNLSLKDRVSIFDRIRASSRTGTGITTGGTGILNSSELSTPSRPPSSRSNNCKNFGGTSSTSSGGFPSSSSVPTTTCYVVGGTTIVPGKFPTFPITSSSSSSLGSHAPTTKNHSSVGIFNNDPPLHYQSSSSRNPSRCPSQSQHRHSVFEEFSTPLGFYGDPFDRTTGVWSDRSLFSPLCSAKRRGSTSDVEINTLRQFVQETQTHQNQQQQDPGTGHYSNLTSMSHSIPSQPFYPSPVRNNRVKSMFLASGGGSDAETHSEDGEVSSGGLEVAEIISRSYENSPIVRKKSWRSQKKAAQQNFTKEIWRKCVQHDEYTDANSEIFYDAKSEFEDFKTEKYETAVVPPPSSSIPPPATSNLLHILTALSSSNDELDDAKPPISTNSATTQRILRKSGVVDSSSDGTKTPIKSHRRVTEVSVPHPDDESFRKFFKNNNRNFPPICPTSSTHAGYHHFPPPPRNNNNICDQNQHQFPPSTTSSFKNLRSIIGTIETNTQQHRSSNINFSDKTDPTSSSSSHITSTTVTTTTEESSFCSVKRETELLVMKKHMPIVRRKSSGKSKNPLKALAARMDFRNQKYSEVQFVSNKSQDESN